MNKKELLTASDLLAQYFVKLRDYESEIPSSNMAIKVHAQDIVLLLNSMLEASIKEKPVRWSYVKQTLYGIDTTIRNYTTEPAGGSEFLAYADDFFKHMDGECDPADCNHHA